MLKSNLLHISAQKSVLSKRQKEFNRLTKKIEQLHQSMHAFRNGFEQLHKRVLKEMHPMFAEINVAKADTVRAMDVSYPDKLLKKTEHKKLRYLITDISFDLIKNEGFEDLKSIFNKYSEVDFDTIDAETEREAAEMAKNMASMFGVEFEDEDDISTPGQFQEQMFKKLLEQEEAFEEEQRIREEKRAKKPKSQKQLEREEKQKNEEQKLTRTVRSVYMDLVKAFHPDREKVEAEKLRKTEIMQRVTQAYNENNLLDLLKLQMEFDRIDEEHLEKLADEQLLYYNKVLKQQADELENEQFEMIQQLASICDMSPYAITSIETVFLKFNQDVRQLKKEVKKTKEEVALWKDPHAVKAYLKTYKIPKDDDFYTFYE